MKNIYHLKWNNNSRIFTEQKDQELINSLENDDIRLLYGSRLTEEEQRSLNTSLKVIIEKGVNRWISDSRFLLHCIMSAGVFLVSYYFLSYVIRDPLPVIDEIIISLVLGILAYFRLNTQEYKSEKALDRKLQLEQSLSEMPRETSSFLSDVELYLEQLADMDESQRMDITKSGGVPVFFSSERKQLLRLYKAAGSSGKKIRRNDPPELKTFLTQIRDYLKYHSSMV